MFKQAGLEPWRLVVADIVPARFWASILTRPIRHRRTKAFVQPPNKPEIMPLISDWKLTAVLLLTLVLLLPGCATLPQPGRLDASDREVLSRVQVYLESIRTLRARFVQVSADGTSAGTAWIDRPGRLRLQYDLPSHAVLVAARGRVIFAQGNGATSGLPLARTPLSILLADHIVLDGPVTVVSVQRAGTGSGNATASSSTNAESGHGAVEVTVRTTAHPDQGQLSLLLSDGPLELRGLVMVDGRGDTTRLSLSDVHTAVATDEVLFALPGA